MADDSMTDSNVLLDVTSGDPVWAAWSEAAMSEAGSRGSLVINQVVFAELAPGFTSLEQLDAAIPRSVFRREGIPWGAAFIAGQAHRIYRSRGGTRSTPLGDFYIGAHALFRGYTLITRDPARYRTYFPALRLIAP